MIQLYFLHMAQHAEKISLQPLPAISQVPVVVVTPDTGTLGYLSQASNDPMALRLRNVTWRAGIEPRCHCCIFLLGYRVMARNII